MNFIFGNKKEALVENKKNTCAMPTAEAGNHIAQVFVFKDENYLGWDCFDIEKISIGGSCDADLFLSGENLATIHAIFYFKDGQIIVSNVNDDEKVKVNGKDISTFMLGPLDFITIGPYTIKIKIKKKTESTFNLETSLQDTLNHTTDTKDQETPAHENKISGQQHIHDVPAPDEPSVAEASSPHGTKVPEPKMQASDAQAPLFSVREEEEDDEDDEDEDENDIEGVCFLRDEFSDNKKTPDSAISGEILLEVVKFREDSVIDVCYLNKKQKYYCGSERGRFCLAENKNSEKCYFYFNDQFKGNVHGTNTPSMDTRQLLSMENLYNKKKKNYRYLLPQDGEATISDGYYDYILRRIVQGRSPHMPDPPKEKIQFHKALLKSALFHLVALLCAGFLFSWPKRPEPTPESRFVQMDTRKISELTRKNANIQKPKTKEIKATTPSTVKTAKKKTKPRKKPQQSASLKKRQGRNKGQAKTASRSPRAGGGSGKGGNVSNRNVNVKQVGLLGAIGLSDGIGLTAKTAMAAVTNLDAVQSSHASEGKLKVGGIVGKLGTDTIEIPKAGLVTTKGSSQAMRSAGVSGKGTVAALAKGKTGQQQVMAMVSAKLNKSVSIQGGGMSREAVKKVIDQHLDEISYCYESALITDPSIMGKIVYEWKILLSGSVGEVRIKSSSIKSSDIHSCIKEAIKTWKFPKPKGSTVVVSYPFIFDIVGF